MASVDRLRIAASLLLALTGSLACSQSDDGGAAPGPVVCEKNEEVLALADATLGFSPAEVIARFGGVREATLEYYEGGTTELSLELSLTGAAVRVTTSLPAGEDPDDALEPCDRVYMRLPLELRFTTADGRFDERFAATWELEELPERESIYADPELADLKGSFTADVDRLSIVVSLGEGEPNGVVIGVIEEEDELAIELNVARFNTDMWPQTE